MATLYWDIENGNDGNDGLAITTPKATWAGVKTAAGGSVSAGDEVRILGNQKVAEESAGAPGLNITFTQYSDAIVVPTDLTDNAGESFVNGTVILGPDGHPYVVRAENIAGGYIYIYGGYLGATATVASLYVVPGVDTSVNGPIGSDNIIGASGNPIIIDGGWYDSGGGVAAQDTVAGRIVPSVLRDAVSQPFHAVTSDLEYVTYKNFMWGIAPPGAGSGADELIDIGSSADNDGLIFTNVGVFGLLSGVVCRSAINFEATKCHAHALDSVLGSNSFLRVESEASSPDNDTITLTDCTGLDASVALLNVLADPLSLNAGLKITGARAVSSGNYGTVDANLLMVFNGSWRGIYIDDAIARGPYTSGIFILSTGLSKPLSTFSEDTNMFSNIDISGGEYGFRLIVFQPTESVELDTIDVDVKVGAGGIPFGISTDSTRDEVVPVFCRDVNIGQRIASSDDVLYWSGVGRLVFVDSSITDPVWGTSVELLDLFTLGGYVITDKTSYLSFTQTVDQLPGLYKTLTAFPIPATPEVVETGRFDQDNTIKTGEKPSTKTTLESNATGEMRVPMISQAGAGQRQVKMQMRKAASYGAGFPKMRITTYEWNDGDPQPVTVEEPMTGLADVWNEVSRTVVIEYDQYVKIEFVNDGDADGVAWFDEPQIL